MKRLVRDLMKQRDLSKIPMIGKQATISDALQVLERHDSGALLVMDCMRPAGIFSERDFARFALVHKESLYLRLRLSMVMTSKIVFVTPDYKLEDCMLVMTKLHIRHLPVLDEGVPVALLSMRHIMEALIQDNQFMITELTKYVTGSSNVETKGAKAPLPQTLDDENAATNH